MLDILRQDPFSSKEISVSFNHELKVRWEKWIMEGFPEEDKKKILEKYPRKKELFVEPPKINLEILPVMSEIAKKRDGHFVETQNSVGSALSALGAAISLILAETEDGIDQETMMKYLCDAGKLMTDIFYQHSVARKYFITPLLNKSVKPVMDATKPDEWLYGNKFAEQIKEAKAVEKACSSIKAPEKSKTNTQNTNQGNSKNPPARYKQVGQYQRRPLMQFKRRSTYNQRYNQKTPAKTSSHSTTQASSKK